MDGFEKLVLEDQPQDVAKRANESPLDRIRRFIGAMGSRWVRDYSSDGFGKLTPSPMIEKHILPSGEAVLVESIPGQKASEPMGVEVYCLLTPSARLDETEKALNTLAAGVRNVVAAGVPAVIRDESIADVALALMAHYTKLSEQNQTEAERFLKSTRADPRGLAPETDHWLKLAQGHIEQARTYLDRAAQFRSVASTAGAARSTLGGTDLRTDHGDAE